MTAQGGQTAGGGRVDARRALSYVFDDEQWVKKVFIGALGPVAIVGVFFFIGYLVEIARRVAAGSGEPLPEWRGRYSSYFKEGFPAAWALLFWLLPFAAVWVGGGLAVVGFGSGGDSIAVQVVFGLAMMVMANLYAAVVVPSVISHCLARPRFGSMFQFRSIFASVRRIGTGFVTVWVVHLAVLILTFVTIWTIVAVIFTTAYAAMACGHVYGQAARIGLVDEIR